MYRLSTPLRHLASAIAVATTVAMGGCGGMPNLPSQSGTLTNHATSGVHEAKKTVFNPFDDRSETEIRRREIIKNPTVAQVMQPGPLPEMSLGSKDAPVTIIKYASMTCPYCRQFQINTFPQLKRRFIDTGKVRFIIREFPIGFQSGMATIALRCVPASKYFATYDLLMREQVKWVSLKVRTAPILKVARKMGLTRVSYDKCIKDETLKVSLQSIKNRGRTLGVIGTPNFFVNGKLLKRSLTINDIDQIVQSGGAITQAG